MPIFQVPKCTWQEQKFYWQDKKTDRSCRDAAVCMLCDGQRPFVLTLLVSQNWSCCLLWDLCACLYVWWVQNVHAKVCNIHGSLLLVATSALVSKDWRLVSCLWALWICVVCRNYLISVQSANTQALQKTFVHVRKKHSFSFHHSSCPSSSFIDHRNTIKFLVTLFLHLGIMLGETCSVGNIEQFTCPEWTVHCF